MTEPDQKQKEGVKAKFTRTKKVAKRIWWFLDGPDEFMGVPAKKGVPELKNEAGRVGRNIEGRFGHWRKEMSRKHIENRQESFATAMTRHGLSDEDIVKIEAGLRSRSNIEFVLLWTAIVSLTVSIPLAGVLGMVSGLSMTALILTFRMKTSFRLWQVEKRSLAPLKAFFTDDGLKRMFWRV